MIRVGRKEQNVLMIATLALVFGLVWWLGVAALLVPRRGRLAIAVAQGVGLVTLSVLPSAVAQPWVQARTSFNLSEKLWMPLATPGIHAGGRSVREAFEPLADSGRFGPRQTTMLSLWPVFLALALAQTLAMGAFIAYRLRLRDRRRTAGEPGLRPDPVIVVAMAIMLLNAAFNIRWPWWGS